MAASLVLLMLRLEETRGGGGTQNKRRRARRAPPWEQPQAVVRRLADSHLGTMIMQSAWALGSVTQRARVCLLPVPAALLDGGGSKLEFLLREASALRHAACA